MGDRKPLPRWSRTQRFLCSDCGNEYGPNDALKRAGICFCGGLLTEKINRPSLKIKVRRDRGH